MSRMKPRANGTSAIVYNAIIPTVTILFLVVSYVPATKAERHTVFKTESTLIYCGPSRLYVIFARLNISRKENPHVIIKSRILAPINIYETIQRIFLLCILSRLMHRSANIVLMIKHMPYETNCIATPNVILVSTSKRTYINEAEEDTKPSN